MKPLLSLLAVPFFLLFSEIAMSACPSLLDHRMKNLDGEPVDLCQYAGKVVLAVNTASFCGYTKQYKGLEALYQKYRDRGLVVVGFPANDFGGQEPGSNEDIKEFCELTFGVKFPMVEKTSVLPGKANPVFAELARLTGQSPQWNFHKYLISRDGKRAFSYSSAVTPESGELARQLEALLSEKG
jgi:glutathione peroxidase